MSSYITFVLIVCGCFALTTQYGPFGPFSDGYFATNFGAPNYNSPSALGGRDSRSDRGPVLFPPVPATGPEQSSGVVPGASGFGFVPPGSQGPAIPRYYFNGFFIRR